MSSTISTKRNSIALSIIQLIQKAGAIFTVTAIAIFGFWGGHFFLPGGEHSEAMHPNTETEAAASNNDVVLTAEKHTAAKLVTQTASQQPFQAHQSVPGTLNFDASQKVDILATVPCMIKQVLVRRNETVTAGQPILVLRSPEIGVARYEVSQSRLALSLLEKELKWTENTHANIRELLKFLESSPTADQLKSTFDDVSLGEHRGEILAAYAEMKLAQQNVARSNQLRSEGIIPGRTIDQRKSNLEIASAKFKSIREELDFQLTHQINAAMAKRDAAQNQFDTSERLLSALLGLHQNLATSDLPASDTESQDATELVVRASRSGQIVELHAVEAARFLPSQLMAVIADNQWLWVEAQISQRDWHLLKIEPDQKLDVRVPAIPDELFEATVISLGAEVSKTTMAIPLVARLENRKNHFRSGMSVWVNIPTSDRRTTFAVPESAIQRVDCQTFVFVETDQHTFSAREVMTGSTSDQIVEIKSGIEEGDQVVMQGAFFLKSEWLLSEEDE